MEQDRKRMSRDLDLEAGISGERSSDTYKTDAPAPEKSKKEVKRARLVVSGLVILLVAWAAIFTWSAYQDQVSAPDGGENNIDPGVGR